MKISTLCEYLSRRLRLTRLAPLLSIESKASFHQLLSLLMVRMRNHSCSNRYDDNLNRGVDVVANRRNDEQDKQVIVNALYSWRLSLLSEEGDAY